MALLLLLQQFVQAVHQLVVAEFLQLRLLLLGQLALHALEKPVERNRRVRVEGRVDALEILGKRAVELVEMCFILDQGQARQIVKIIHRSADDVLLQRLKQGQKFLDRDGNLRVLEREEEIDQHGDRSPARGSAVMGRCASL
ncbi:hypothetical protein D3C72_1397690 [compost metagenome]